MVSYNSGSYRARNFKSSPRDCSLNYAPLRQITITNYCSLIPLLSLLMFVILYCYSHCCIRIFLYWYVVIVVLLSCIYHHCFVGLFVYCVVSFPCGRTSQDRLYKHDSKNREPYRLQQIWHYQLTVFFEPYFIKAIKIVKNNLQEKSQEDASWNGPLGLRSKQKTYFNGLLFALVLNILTVRLTRLIPFDQLSVRVQRLWKPHCW